MKFQRPRECVIYLTDPAYRRQLTMPGRFVICEVAAESAERLACRWRVEFPEAPAGRRFQACGWIVELPDGLRVRGSLKPTWIEPGDSAVITIE